MIVYINDLPINDDSNGLYLDEPIDGLELPEIRTSSDVYSGRDGGYVGDQFYGTRLVTLPGRAWSADPAGIWDLRRALQQALDTDSIELHVVADDDHHYLLYARTTRLDMPIPRALSVAPFKIDFICPDPIIYDDTDSNALTANIGKYVGGGVSWPLTWPLSWGAGTGATTVNNTGLVTIYPVITITGSQTNPIITNVTTAEFIQLSGFTAPAGSVTVIDLRNRTVTLNGGNVLAKVTSSSTWWGLLPGSNTIRLETGDAADTAAAVMEWRNGYMGI
jgi:phage-related protein